MTQWVNTVLLSLLLCGWGVSHAKPHRFGDHFKYSCSQNEKPSAVPFLSFYAPHMLQFAIDIDFVSAQTGICTSILIALIEQQSGLIRQHTRPDKPWNTPFGHLSDKRGFVAQLVDVSITLKRLQQKSESGMLPASEPLAYLFNVGTLTGGPERLSPQTRLQRFETLYRDMFMTEYIAAQWHNEPHLGFKQEMMLRGWQFRQSLG